MRADSFLSETARLADVVFPITQRAEASGIITNLKDRILCANQKAQEAPTGARRFGNSLRSGLLGLEAARGLMRYGARVSVLHRNAVLMNDQAHPPQPNHSNLTAEPKPCRKNQTGGGRVQRLVVAMLLS